MARAQTAKTIKAEIIRSWKKARKMLLDSMAQNEPGTRAYMDHVLNLFKLDQAHRDEMVRRGLAEENLKQATTKKYVFKAIVSNDDGLQWDAERQAFNDALDAEFFGTTPEQDQHRPTPEKRSEEGEGPVNG
jgi:hypothetical protein